VTVIIDVVGWATSATPSETGDQQEEQPVSPVFM
jgi:hypothetical protein